MRYRWFLLCGILMQVGTAAAVEGKPLYQRDCAGCHGRNADKKALDRALPLRSLSEEDIVNGLKDRREGKIVGAGNRAKARLSDEDIQALAVYLSGLNK